MPDFMDFILAACFVIPKDATTVTVAALASSSPRNLIINTTVTKVQCLFDFFDICVFRFY